MERSKRAAAATASKRLAESEGEDFTPTKKKTNSKKSTIKKQSPKIQVVEEIPIEFELSNKNPEEQFDDDDDEGIPAECFLEVNIQEQDNEAQLQHFNYQLQHCKSFNGKNEWDPLEEGPKTVNNRQGVSNFVLKSIINRYPCGFCDTVFTDPSFLIRHHKRCKSKRAAECSSVPRIPGPPVNTKPTMPLSQNRTESDELLEMYGFHHQIVKGKKMFCCNQCSFTTRNPDHLKYHKPIHNNDKVIKCEKCSFASRDSNQMNSHKLTHSNLGPVPDMNANRMDILALQNVKELYNCDQCNYTSTRPGYLIMHKRIHSRDQPYVCTDCGYKCARLSYYNKHRMSHHGEVDQQSQPAEGQVASAKC